MNKKKSKVLAFLLAASLLVPSVNGIVSAAELDNVKSANKVVVSQETTNPDGSDTSTQDSVTQNVAKIGDKEYATLTEAINNADDGATIELLGDVTEDITVNKNVTIDGKKDDKTNYVIIGNTKLENGTLKNATLKPKDDDKTGSVLQIGSTAENTINMYGVAVEYSVVNRSGGSNVVGGNNSNITIGNCLFTNNPNNGDTKIGVLEWSFGLSMGSQDTKGSFDFINNEFNGAFRTMLPSINGKVTIQGNKFNNSVLTVSPGTGNGANAQATCITTLAKLDSNDFTITDNTFNNPGAFYFQDIANVQNNTFVFDNSGHYIQLGGKVGRNLDLRNNTFKTESDGVVSIDTEGAQVILPAGQTAINYWAWNDTPVDIRPDGYSSYKYIYNSDGNKIFYPESEAALKAFTNPASGNIGAGDKDRIVVSNDMTIGDKTTLDIPKDKKITIEVPAGKTLTLDSEDAMNITGTLNLVGDGKVVINKGAELNVGDTGKLNVEIPVENNGTMDNAGEIIIDTNNGGITGNNPTGSGKVEYEYTPSYPSYPSKPTYTHEEIIGSDRYETAARIADKLGSYDNVVLVNAESSMSDGLAASGLAGKENGAILLTKKDSIPQATMDRIKKVKKVYIIGGEAAISAKVANEITAVGIKVERLGGKTRVETSEIVAKKLGNYSDAFVVNGFKGESDAMSASAIAAKKGAPILLTNGKTSTHAKKSGVEYYVIGGDNVVDKSIADKYNAKVLAGKDRYATNKEVINEFYSGSDKVYIANGDKLVDVLTASPLAKKDGIVLVNEKSDKSILKGKNTVQVGGMDFKIEFEK
ncbi:cell wall-binding repeat-containing protein [Peptoclostridium sp. AF21-18]|uniref:cell wall-binding repeat-containing protein n=1 Tax=Peptoclostridium sp. AF21-18 TaxID=2292243 RepID=UPI000E484A5F|nr:cell wall-binding repeat-containing protein [Peptoclostridium sp. AF21-18]RHQ97590.1 cell wall-binding repeat-containing protein [Peptoclostridium sp. AF21-18]